MAFEGNAYGQNYATGGGYSAGNGGGGFFAGAGGGGAGSQSNGQGVGKASGAQTLRPLTAHQINNATQAHAEAEFMVDGSPVGQLTFFGCVQTIQKNATNMSYTIGDGTGAVEVRVWIDASTGGSPRIEEITEYSYVGVIGKIASFTNRRYIKTGHMRRITDPNQIFYHKLTAMNAHLQAVKQGGLSTSKAGGEEKMNLDNAKRYDDLENPVHRKIMQHIDALHDMNPDNGVHISAVARKMPNQNEKTVRDEIEHLIAEGYLYTAEDEDHVMSTMSAQQ